MALLDRFRKKSIALPKAAEAPTPQGETLSRDMAELNDWSSFGDSQIDKSLAYQDYTAFQNLDENGGFFGPEFQIRATAARLKGLYVQEPWIYTAATLIARTLSSIPLRVYDRQNPDKHLPNHPLAKLLQQGGPIQDGRSLLWNGYLDLVLGGNFFLICDAFYMSLTQAPVELVSLNLGDVNTPGIESITVANPTKMGYRYLVPKERFIQLKLPNPNNPFYGLSPFAAASRPILLDRYMGEYTMAAYLRGCTHSGVIETTQDISRQRFERLMRSFEQTMTGKRNWFRQLFLPKGATWKNGSLTMSEMQHLDILKENRKTILAVLGIPPSLVGLTEDVNYATSEAQTQIFYESTILPYMGFVEDGFNNSYLIKNVYRGQFMIKADTSVIKCLQDTGELSIKGQNAKAVEDFFTINEIRSMIFNREPHPNGDKFVAELKKNDNALFGSKSIEVKADDALSAGNTLTAESLIFSKDKFKSAEDAKKWAADHAYKFDQVDETGTSFRLRQRAAEDFDESSLRSVELGDGVSAVMGHLKGNAVAHEPAKAIDGAENQGTQKLAYLEQAKAHAHSNVMNIERTLGTAFKKGYDQYLKALFKHFEHAVESKQEIKHYLKDFAEDRAKIYWAHTKEPLFKAMGRGYSSAMAQTKSFQGYQKAPNYRFDDYDVQAIDVLRDRKKAKREGELEGKVLDRFYGFDETRSQQIWDLVEQGYNDGKALPEIARSIVDGGYEEHYGDQAFTIARTEVLSALSAGTKAYQNDLQELFSKDAVKKQWISVGDSHVRDSHIEYEALGEVDVDYDFADGLTVPRDYGADAGDVINCRCSLVNSIEPSASSRASSILDE